MVAAAITIVLVGAVLWLSRADLASELAVVRSDLTAVQADVADRDVEIEELEDEVNRLEGGLETCGQLAEISVRARQAVDQLARALRSDQQGAVASGLIAVFELSTEWRSAIEDCQEASGGNGE